MFREKYRMYINWGVTVLILLVLAINLADDADTVGAVTGQIAGALYGASAIPGRWLEREAGPRVGKPAHAWRGLLSRAAFGFLPFARFWRARGPRP